jgi:hypothetical protein
MNIELDEVVVHNASDDAMELAAGGAQGGLLAPTGRMDIHCFPPPAR